MNSIRYAGEFYDSEIGLYYLRARYYDPYIGRFISEDSYWGEDTNPLSLNLYTYAHNDPIQFIDPTGHSILGAIGGTIGGLIGGSGGAAIGTAVGETINAVVDNIKDHKNDRGKKNNHNSSRGGSSNTPDFAKMAIRLMAQAQVKAALTGNESSQSLLNMIDAQKKSEEAALQAGKMTEAELYQQKAEILLQKLNDQQATKKKPTTTVNVLRIGDEGDAVEKLQRLLIGAGITQVMIDGKTYQLEPDGDFGRITAEAVKVYQRNKGLAVDGIVGPQTIKSLIGSNFNEYGELLDKMQSGNGQYNNDEIEAQRLAGVASAQDIGYPGGTIGLSPPVPQGTGNGIKQVVGDFAKGTVSSLDNNIALGIGQATQGQIEGNSTAYYVGKLSADVVTMVGGAITAVAGGGAELLGIAADSTIVAAPAGVALNVAGTAAIAGGAAVTANSYSNFVKDVNMMMSEGESKGSTNNWGNKNTLQDYFDRHGSDFGAKKPNDYAKKANDFYNNRSNYQVKVDENGVTRVYDPSTNTFGSYNPDGTTRTFYKPTGGQKYFNFQPGK